MGTRNVIKVINNLGETKVSQYGQWDGYPSGQGTKVLFYATHFLKEIETGLSNCRFIEGDELNSVFAPFTNGEGMMTMEQSNDMNRLFPTLLRDAGGDVLGYIAFSTANNPVLLSNEPQDDLNDWCEGIYILDFLNKKFVSKYDDRVVTFSLDALPDHTTYIESWGSTDDSGASFDPLGNADYPHIQPLWASDSMSDTDGEEADLQVVVETSNLEVVQTSDLKEKFKCPTCDGYIPNNAHIGKYAGAISRKDNTTEICSACGTLEAITEWVEHQNGQ